MRLPDLSYRGADCVYDYFQNEIIIHVLQARYVFHLTYQVCKKARLRYPRVEDS